MTKNEVKKLMESSKTIAEWNENCDKVKSSHNGQYPDFWYKEIVLSGLMKRTEFNYIDYL